MFLITGATGNIGRGVVNLLHRSGHDVRALVRSQSRGSELPDGVHLAVGDLDDADSVTAALHGVDAVFLLHVGVGTTQTQTLVDAAMSANVRRVVLLSSIGARLRPLPLIGKTLAAREDILRASGLDVTFLRPNGLMSNALWWAEEIRTEGRVTDCTGDGRQAVVDPSDIARVAARVLTEDGHRGHGYILSGPEALTAREQAATLSEVLDRPLAYVDITPEQSAQNAIERGTPAPMAHARENLDELFRAGRAGVLTDDIENLTGIAPGTFRGWAEEHAEAFS